MSSAPRQRTYRFITVTLIGIVGDMQHESEYKSQRLAFLRLRYLPFQDGLAVRRVTDIIYVSKEL